MEGDPDLIRAARDIAETHSSVELSPLELPEITGDPLTDVSLQFALNPDEVPRFAADNGFDEEFLALKLLGIANDIGGGLSPEGKRMWLFLRLSDGLTLDEIVTQAKKLKASPAT